MILVTIAVFFTLSLCVVALRANTRLRRIDRLPMQWSLTGRVTWSASRPVALAVMPALAACTFVALLFLAFDVRPRTGQDNMVLPTFIGLGMLWLAIQRLHLWLAARMLRRPRG